MKILPVVLTCDDAYTKYASVTLLSLLDNAASDTQIDVYIVSEGVSLENQNALQDVVQQYPNASLEFVWLRDFDADAFYLGIDHINATTYYRFFVADLLPKCDRVLYLDCDIAVVGDVSALADMEFGGALFLACQDQYIRHLCEDLPAVRDDNRRYFEETLGLASYRDYFNAGVFVLDAKKARQIGLSALLIDALKTLKTPRFQDQCVLNAVAAKHGVRLIDGGYNFSANSLNDWRWCNARKRLQADLLARRPFFGGIFVLHYISADKPWRKKTPAGFAFYHYARQSPFFAQIQEQGDFLLSPYASGFFGKKLWSAYCAWRDGRAHIKRFLRKIRGKS